WFRYLIFTPLWRKTRSFFLAVSAAFILSFWLHDAVRVMNAYQSGPMSLEIGSVKDKFLFFFVHGLGVYLSLKLNRFWFRADTRAGWLGVLITWFWMIWVHHYVRYF